MNKPAPIMLSLWASSLNVKVRPKQDLKVLTKNLTKIVINLVAPKAAAKLEPMLHSILLRTFCGTKGHAQLQL